MINDLADYIRYLNARGRLRKIGIPVSPELEITAYTDIADRERPYESKALLFQNVDGYNIPVATNLFGSLTTLNELFGNTYARELLSNLDAMKSQRIRPSIIKSGKMLMDAKPKVVESQLGKYQKLGSLDELPILKVWPKDAGKFITLPLVITESPKDGTPNIGIYRMQVFDGQTAGMHWQAQKGGAIHAREAIDAKKNLNVSAVIGTDPINIVSAVAPLPVGFNEFSFSGIVRGAKTILMKNGKYPAVPANAEVIINGHVDPNEKRLEGPFGDHTGYYSIPEEYPVFHVDAIYAKKNPIYAASVVGYPWHEDAAIGQFLFDFLKPLLRSMNESIVDVYLPPEGVFTNMCFVSIKKRFPGEAKKVMFSLLGLGQLSFTKMMVVFDDDINIRNVRNVLWALATRVEPQRDVQIITNATADSLDHTTNVTALGSKMLIDATRKTREEGYTREWPDTISLPDELVKSVEKKWQELR
ncbi:MAG: UbiD family decarboxylase [Candidatus Micrarchaeales archaeon]|nr:UbiD family decarboxylase [Candidatus Micrarchaeales archaeon]